MVKSSYSYVLLLYVQKQVFLKFTDTLNVIDLITYARQLC